MTFGFSVNTYAVGDLVTVINQVADADVDKLADEYESVYNLAKTLHKGGEQHAALRDAARIELGMKYFLEDGDFKAYTNTFEDLYGMKQLPGIASQRLMQAGYGYGGEGDWKNVCDGPCIESDGSRLTGWQFIHGRLHLSFQSGQ